MATQLSAKLTKHLVLTDPYRIKSPAETVTADFQLPLGVQLLYVYLDCKQFMILHKDAAQCKSLSENITKKEDKKVITVYVLATSIHSFVYRVHLKHKFQLYLR